LIGVGGLKGEMSSMKLQKTCIGLAISCALLFVLTFRAPAETLSVPSNNEALQKAIHDYILAHPDVLIQSLRMAKAQEQERLAAVTKSNILALKKALIEDPNAPILGNPAGDVTLVEFFDYRCPYCRQVEASLQSLIKSDPGVRIVQKQFPVLGPASVYAARVALAANKQGKHSQFHEALMSRRSNLDEATVLSVAEEAGLDVARIKSDMNAPEIEAELSQNREIAKVLNLTGTPAFIVGEELVPGATDLETLKAMVDDARHGVN
jgi:protein-disulfide isomerase